MQCETAQTESHTRVSHLYEGGTHALGRDALDVMSLALTLSAEVARVCVLAGLSLGISNAMAHQDERVNARELIAFYPRESAPLILASSRLKRFFPMLCLDAVLRQFHNAVAAAKAETMALAALGFELPVNLSNGEPALVAAWKHASIAGLALISALHEAIACLGFAGSADEDTQLREFISAAIAGRYTLDANGSIAMPEWAERRQSRRLPVHCAAILIHKGQEQAVTVRDISTRGLGIEGGQNLVPADTISIVMHGVFLKGTIAWVTHARAGVRLERPIHSDDPRFDFCSVASAEQKAIEER